jgi:signal transduction histidine kinase
MIGRQAAAGFVISVEDDGAGIPAEQLERMMARLMVRGMRADEAQPGHGLGLAIVHEMVLAYDGDIDFSVSPQLHGLQVTIHIPKGEG